MPSLSTIAIVAILAAAAGAVIYALRVWMMKRIEAGGAAADRAERAEADLAIAKKQAEAMAKDLTTEDVARSLDAGEF